MAIEARTRGGKRQARCPTCGRWRAFTREHWYFRKGEDVPYLNRCRECERTRSAEWHRAHPRKAKKPKSQTART